MAAGVASLPDAKPVKATVAYLVRSFPRLSQTFVLNEILALERLGVDLRIFGMTAAAEGIVQESVADVAAPTRYLQRERSPRRVLEDHARVVMSHPLGYLSAWLYVLTRKELDEGYVTCSRYSCFAQAVRMAAMLLCTRGEADGVDHVHGHFAHDPTLIALLLKKMIGVSFSFTAHARDIYQTTPIMLRERIGEASAVVTCCRANLDYLEAVARREDVSKLKLIHHGVDLMTFRPPSRASFPMPSSRSPAPLILSAGRLVEKKGFGDLIRACRLLSDLGVDFRCVIYGDGPLRETLERAIEELGLNGRVAVAGACTQAELAEVLRSGDVFALTPYVADDGDRDGIPNSMLEAMACELPVVGTVVGGMPEVVAHGHNGFLSRPHDARSIASHLARLLADEPLRRRMGARARVTVAEGFDGARAARQLAALFARAQAV